MKTHMYRHFNKAGELLYVGISLSAVQRLSNHSNSKWFDEISHITIEQFDTRAAALSAEKQAIIEESPKYNVQHRHEEPEPKNEAIPLAQPPPQYATSDRLLTFSEVGKLVGSHCKTGHYARSLAANGLIRSVRINSRVIRYSERSVMALIAGRHA